MCACIYKYSIHKYNKRSFRFINLPTDALLTVASAHLLLRGYFDIKNKQFSLFVVNHFNMLSHLDECKKTSLSVNLILQF